MSLIVERRDAVTVLTIDRPEVRNAFDETLIAALTEAFAAAGRDAEVRAVLLQANGPVFSAGADLGWMRRMADAPAAENLADARRLAALMSTIDTCPKPTVARIHGLAFAGAVGLIACCDIAVAATEAEFAISEVRLGLIPSVIGPYVVRAVGAREARRLILTAERISASEAHRIGLVHEVVPADRLDAAVEKRLAALIAAGPKALAAAKDLVATIDRPIDAALIEETARRIAEIRRGPEAREGIGAFLEKRKPGWTS